MEGWRGQGGHWEAGGGDAVAPKDREPMSGCRGLWCWGEGDDCCGVGGCFPSDENVLEMVVMVAGLCADTKNCFDQVNFTVCGFYLKF